VAGVCGGLGVSEADAVVTAFNHMLEKLRIQQAYIVSLRNQAGLSAAVTGLIANVFGGLYSKGANPFEGDFFIGLSLPGIFAVGLLAASIACSAMVVVHYSNFTFSFDTKLMLEKINDSSNYKSFLRSYILDGEWYFSDNERLISEAQTKLWFAMVFGFCQILPWIILLRSGS
jgi:hypothetical protein